MKKSFITIAFLVFLVLAISTNAFAESLKITYDLSAYTVNVSGKAEKAREPVYVHIFQFDTYKDEYLLLTEADMTASPARTAIIKTFISDMNRNVDQNVVIPSDGTIPSGRYIYVASTYGYNKSGIIIVMPTSVFSDEIKTKVNSTNTSDIVLALKDSTLMAAIDDKNADEAKYTYIAESIENMKPDAGYDVESFVNAYLIAEGLYNHSIGIMSLEKMLELYSVAFDSDYHSVYTKLDSTTKDAVSNLFKTNKISGAFSKEFADNVFASNYFTTKSSTELKTLVLEYLDDNSISVDSYTKLNTQRQENVFTYLYNQKSTLITAKAIVDKFNYIVTTQLDEQNKNSEGGNSDGGGGGGGTGASSTIVNVVTPPLENEKFIDMKYHWSKDAVYSMANAGIINGYEDNTFKPDNNITRSEFVKIICTAFNIKADRAHNFSDVEKGSWYEQYVSSASSSGLIYGSNGEFRPNSPITRQDAAVIIKRLLDMRSIPSNASIVQYKDYEIISSYARDAVNVLSNLNLLKGYDGYVNPTGNLTRAEAATLLSRCIEYISNPKGGI